MTALDIATVKAHLARLEELAPDEPSWWRVGPRWDDERIGRFESEHFALPADYRAWLAEIGDGGAGLYDAGLLPLSAKTAHDLAAAARPFALRKEECRTFKWPVSGMLFLSKMNGGNDARLVVQGKHAGDIWVDGTMYGGTFFRDTTFSEQACRWIRHSLAKAEAHARPRDARELGALTPSDRWSLLVKELVPWLKAGSQTFIDTFRGLPLEEQEHAAGRLTSAVRALTERWLRDRDLAAVAATVLRAVQDAHDLAMASDPMGRLLDAMFTERDPPDTSPANVAELVRLLRGATEPQRSAANSLAKWLQLKLVDEARLDEAIALLRVQPYLTEDYWVALGRALIAAGRGAEAFAVYDAIVGAEPTMWRVARAWLQLEADTHNSIKRPKKGDLYAKIRAQQEGWGFGPPKTMSLAESGPAGVRPRTAEYQLVALLFGSAGDGVQMAEVASGLLALEGRRRYASEYENHRAHHRMGLALAGRSPPREPRLSLGHYGGNVALAAAILQRTGEIGVDLVDLSAND